MRPLPASLLKQAAAHRLQHAERCIEPAVVGAMQDWLAAVRFTIIREWSDLTGITAAASGGRHRKLGRRFGRLRQTAGSEGTPSAGTRVAADRAVAAAASAWNDWRRSVENNVLPAVAVQFGEAFQQTRLAHRDRGSFTPQMEFMATVADRLRIWPEGAFENIRPELTEALAEAETVEQITDRVGMVLGIDKDQRAIKAAIREVEARLDDPDVDPVVKKALRGRRRRLWEQHDEEETRWRWLARRIARTEAHAAIQAGQLAAARQNEADTGETWFKRWLCVTDDTRTRVTHRVADGQSVPLSAKFRVGGFLLDFPGDPITIAPQETINCRCDLLIYHPDSMQDALQGPDGSLGEVRPEGVRIGPDDPDEVRRVVDEVAARENRTVPDTIDRRGEDHGQPAPADPVDVELTDQREAPQLGVVPDLATYSEDDLLDLMTANLGSNDGLYEAARDEYDRRAGFTAAATDRRRREFTADGSASGDHDDDAMIALLPSAADAARLAVDGGEPVDELHLTLAYFPDAGDLGDVEAIAAQITGLGPISAEVSGHAVFRDGDEPCAVYLVQGDGLSRLHDELAPEGGAFDAYVPHITAVYDEARLTETGPIVFDRLRISVRGQHHDLVLGDEGSSRGSGGPA